MPECPPDGVLVRLRICFLRYSKGSSPIYIKEHFFQPSRPKVLTGRNKEALYEAICINTDPIFYIAGEVQNLKEGGKRARQIIDSGRAIDKLMEWVQAQNRSAKMGKKRLESLLKEIQ